MAQQRFTGHCIIKTADELGFSTDYMEAELIAFLAIQALKHEPVSIPQITGATTAGYAKLIIA